MGFLRVAEVAPKQRCFSPGPQSAYVVPRVSHPRVECSKSLVRSTESVARECFQASFHMHRMSASKNIMIATARIQLASILFRRGQFAKRFVAGSQDSSAGRGVGSGTFDLVAAA